MPTMVTGNRARSNWSTNREDIDFAKGIALLDPNENPFTLATMDMGKKTTRTIQHSWFEDELVPESDTVNQASLDATSTAWTVDNGARFAVGDLVMHNASREVVLVTAVSSNDLTVIRDYGEAEGWTALDGSPADGAYLTVIGNAFEQGHPLPTIRSTVEVQYDNYCQDVRTPIGMSEVAEASAVRGEDDWNFQRRKAAISHQRKLEYMNFWGKPYVGGKAYYSSNILPTTAGGINHFISENAPAAQKKDETEITSTEFQEWLEYLFEYGSGTKWCYCDPNLRTALDQWGISKLNTFVSDTYYGMAVDRWKSSHGTVIFVTHKMLKNPESTDYKYAFFLDMEKVAWTVFQKIGSTRLRKLEPYKATGATVKQEEYQTISCIEFGQAACHGRLRWKTIGA